MKLQLILMAGLLGLGCFSCAPNSGGNRSSSQTNSSTPSLQNNAVPGQSAAQRPAVENPPPIIPKDARWTIYCRTFATPDHALQAKSVRSYLVQSTHRQDWYVVQGQDQSTLYYGFYRSVNAQEDKAEAERAHADCKAIGAMLNPDTGDRLFQIVSLVNIDSDDPVAPPEWNLLNARGAYTLQIGVYRDSPDRKAFAVEAVRAARQQGIEAYYFHGPTASSVCVGVWGDDAVKATEEIRATSPNMVPMVVPDSVPAPKGELSYEGKPVEVVRPQMEVLDPTLSDTMKKFPNMAINGKEGRMMYNPRTGQKRMVVEPSEVVRVPREVAPVAGPSIPSRIMAPPDLSTPPEATAVSTPPAPAPRMRPVAPSLPAAKGGKLKSIED